MSICKAGYTERDGHTLTTAQGRILDALREYSPRVYSSRKRKPLERLRALGLITFTVEPHPNCGRPVLFWQAYAVGTPVGVRLTTAK